MFVIEDEAHDEPLRRFDRRDDALAELRRLSTLPWDQAPNRAPCTRWRTCGRRYELVEYDTGSRPWRELRRQPMLEVTQAAVTWLDATDAA